MPEMPVSLLAWKKQHSGTLRGFARVRISYDIVINDVAVHAANGKRWTYLPSRPILDKDGNPRRDRAGNIVFIDPVEWCNKDLSHAFSCGVIAAVEREYPGETLA